MFPLKLGRDAKRWRWSGQQTTGIWHFLTHPQIQAWFIHHSAPWFQINHSLLWTSSMLLRHVSFTTPPSKEGSKPQSGWLSTTCKPRKLQAVSQEQTLVSIHGLCGKEQRFAPFWSARACVCFIAVQEAWFHQVKLFLAHGLSSDITAPSIVSRLRVCGLLSAPPLPLVPFPHPLFVILVTCHDVWSCQICCCCLVV